MKKLTLITAIIFTVGIFTSLNLKSQNSNLANIDDFILEQMEVFHAPGLSACIIKGDSVVWNSNYGIANIEEGIPVGNETLFGVLSVGKSLTAAVLMQIWENGLLGLTQDINSFLQFQIDNPYTSQDSISPRMLMPHTSSIKDYGIWNYVTIGDPTMELSFFLENYLSPEGQFYSNNNFYPETPGYNYHYTNFGPALNGYLVESLTGESFKDYARDSLLIPLEMNNSGWFFEEINIGNLAIGYNYEAGEFLPNPYYSHPAYPALTLKCSALELSNYVIMLLNNGTYNGVEILQDATVDSMATIQNPVWGDLGTPGLGLYCRKDYGNRTVWGHNGGSVTGYAAHFYFCKEENTGIVITTNSNQYVDPIVLQMFEYAGLMVIAQATTEITSTGFKANWQAAPTATGYLLDVAFDDEFANFLDGYQNLNTGQDTTIYVTGLDPGTEYYYRIRAYNSVDTGAYSQANTQTTLFTGTNELIHQKNIIDFDISPNPVSEEVILSFNSVVCELIEVYICDISGTCIKSYQYQNAQPDQKKLILDLKNIPAGMYFLQMKAGNEMVTKKIIKVK